MKKASGILQGIAILLLAIVSLRLSIKNQNMENQLNNIITMQQSNNSNYSSQKT